jgi:hypothetical protein
MNVQCREAYDRFLDDLILWKPTNISMKNLIFIVKAYYSANLDVQPELVGKSLFFHKNDKSVEVILGIKDQVFFIYRLNDEKFKEQNVTSTLGSSIDEMIEFLKKGKIQVNRKVKSC